MAARQWAGAVTAAVSSVLLLTAPADAPAAQTIADGVRVVAGGFAPGRQPDGNSVLFDGPAGSVLVDSGRHVEHQRALLAAVAATARPLAAIVSTHWHLDHLGGNALLRREHPGVRVYASAAVGAALSGWLADSERRMRAQLAGAGTDAATRGMIAIDLALIGAGTALLPDVVVVAPRRIDDGGLPLEIGIARQAATDADLWVYDRRTKVLAAGDLVTLPVPFFDTACADGWQEALARLDAVDFERLVPGHGPVLGRAEFARWRGAFDGLLACTDGEQPAAACSDGWIAALGALLPPADHRRARAMLGYYIAEHLRALPDKRRRHCRGG